MQGGGREKECIWVSVRVWGDYKKNKPVREKARELGRDLMMNTSQVMGGGGSGFYPNGCKQAMDTARGPQQKDDQTPALERTLAAELTVDWKAAVLEKTLWQPR